MAATLEPFLRAIDDLLACVVPQGWRVLELVISIPGMLDTTARRPGVVPILPSLNDLPLCDLLEARYQLPVRLIVDVDAVLAGEHRFGAGKGYQRLLYLSLNAVVGAAFAVQGELDRSARVGIGHVAHVPIASSGPRCSCGRRGCINSLLSLEAIQKMALRALQRVEETGPASDLLSRGSISPQILAEAALREDRAALRIYEEIGRWLGAAVGRYIGLFQPDAIILGGGMLSANEVLFASIQSTLTMHISTVTHTPLKILLAYLSSDAALIGAAATSFQKDGKEYNFLNPA